MKSTMANLFFALFLIIIFGCGSDNSELAKVKYGMDKFERNFGVCDSANAGCATILFEYPRLKYAIFSSVKDSISNFILNEFLNAYGGKGAVNSLDALADSLFKDFLSLQNESLEFRQSWEIQGLSSIVYNNHFIVTIQTEIYSYTGSAHPNSKTTYANFNSTNGKRIFLIDLLKDNYEEELNKIAARIFRKVNGLTIDQNLEEAGYWFVDNKFSLNDNFGIKDDGLLFYFNAYEIAPYSMGQTEVFVPYSNIENLIAPNSLLSAVVDEIN